MGCLFRVQGKRVSGSRSDRSSRLCINVYMMIVKLQYSMINHLDFQLHYFKRKYECDIDARIDGLVQDCSNSSASAIELLQSCTKPLIWSCQLHWCLFCRLQLTINKLGLGECLAPFLVAGHLMNHQRHLICMTTSPNLVREWLQRSAWLINKWNEKNVSNDDLRWWEWLICCIIFIAFSVKCHFHSIVNLFFHLL